MECAVTAAWLLITPGSGQTLSRDGASKRLTAFNVLVSLGEETGRSKAQAQDALAQLAAANGPRSFAFEQSCRSLDGGDWLYLHYRLFSANSHSSLAIADFYSVAMEDSPVG